MVANCKVRSASQPVKAGDGLKMARWWSMWLDRQRLCMRQSAGQFPGERNMTVVRIYHPFFLNDWRYISDDSARASLFADTSSGREYQVVTAQGYLRQNFYAPWFIVRADENDTAEVTAS